MFDFFKISDLFEIYFYFIESFEIWKAQYKLK
jgi:hypothetical protein